MTYLEIVNQVLRLLREEELTTLSGVQDEFHKVVIQNVNDAKRKVEQAWRWNAHYGEYPIVTVNGQDQEPITGVDSTFQIERVLNADNGYELRNITRSHMAILRNRDTVSPRKPTHYCFEGQNANREPIMRFWPVPSDGNNIIIYGFQWQPPLVNDDDELVIPALPVIYEALAMSARERGEVGGQTALEIFGMAKRYLDDAIAQESALEQPDTVWISV